MSDTRGIGEVNGVQELKDFADSKWRAANGGKLFDVYHSYHRELSARVATGGRAVATRAVDAAAGAFPAWSQTTPGSSSRSLIERSNRTSQQPPAGSVPNPCGGRVGTGL